MQSQSKENPHYKPGQPGKRRIAIFCPPIMASTSILVAKAVIKERTAALHRARIEAADISAGFEEQVRGTLNGVAGASEFLKNHIEEEEARGEALDLIG